MGIGDKPAFPGNRNKEFQCIQEKNTLGNFFSLFIFFGKIGGGGKFEQIKKSIFNAGANGIPCSLSNMRDNILPNQISLFDTNEDGGTLEREREEKRAGSYLR